ncbi:MAG: carboxypeptidase regulatory-like domain-containing protein, partial [Blastocatellia bacterium]|nr:carboxypeptidase regulatory-like domain-containing protein [Blastocatellia bacterium]
PGTTVNTATNTITAPGVFQFSDWGVGNAPAVPTASNVSVSGRVMTPDGRGLRNAVVHLTDANGQVQTTRTSAFGYYRFDDVESGQTVVISVTSKQYSFAQRIINLTDSVTDLDLVALPE